MILPLLLAYPGTLVECVHSERCLPNAERVRLLSNRSLMPGDFEIRSNAGALKLEVLCWCGCSSYRTERLIDHRQIPLAEFIPVTGAARFSNGRQSERRLMEWLFQQKTSECVSG